MRKILILTCFAIATLVVFGMFISATSYIQLVVAALTYPLLVYVAFVVFPRKHFSHNLTATTIALQVPLVAQKAESAKTDGIGIADIDKRVFLKLIGATGISLFLFSIISRKTEGLFFKSVQPTTASGVSGRLALEDLDGKKINPAQSHPTDGYSIAEMDDSLVTFYGFTNKDGAWYVMREDPDTGSFRYARGDSNFPGNWTNREKLQYDYFSNVFKN